MDIRYSKVIVGNYAAVPVEDPFDSSKTAYWLYKENYSICVYLFSCEGLTNAEIQKRLSGEELAKSIALLETRWRKKRWSAHLWMASTFGSKMDVWKKSERKRI